MHLAIDAETQEVEAVLINDFKDSEILPDLLEQIEVELNQVSGDDGYDSHDNYQLISYPEARSVISLREDAFTAQYGNSKLPALPRDQVICKIRQLGKKIERSRVVITNVI